MTESNFPVLTAAFAAAFGLTAGVLAEEDPTSLEVAVLSSYMGLSGRRFRLHYLLCEYYGKGKNNVNTMWILSENEQSINIDENQ